MLCFYATDMSSRVLCKADSVNHSCMYWQIHLKSQRNRREVTPWSTWPPLEMKAHLFITDSHYHIPSLQLKPKFLEDHLGWQFPLPPPPTGQLLHHGQNLVTPLPALPTVGFSLFLSVLNTHPRKRTATPVCTNCHKSEGQSVTKILLPQNRSKWNSSVKLWQYCLGKMMPWALSASYSYTGTMSLLTEGTTKLKTIL